MGTIEKEIMSTIKERLEMGEKQYGPFKPEDGRDFIEETLEEILDALIYVARELKKVKARRDR